MNISDDEDTKLEDDTSTLRQSMLGMPRTNYYDTLHNRPSFFSFDEGMTSSSTLSPRQDTLSRPGAPIPAVPPISLKQQKDESTLNESVLVSSPRIIAGTLKKGQFSIPLMRLAAQETGSEGEEMDPIEAGEGAIAKFNDAKREMEKQGSGQSRKMSEEDMGFDPVEARESQVVKFNDLQRQMDRKKENVLSNSMSKLKEDGSE